MTTPCFVWIQFRAEVAWHSVLNNRTALSSVCAIQCTVCFWHTSGCVYQHTVTPRRVCVTIPADNAIMLHNVIVFVFVFVSVLSPSYRCMQIASSQRHISSTLPHKRQDFRKKLLKIKCVFGFSLYCCLNISLQLLSEHFSTAAVWTFLYSCCLNISLQLLSEHFSTAAVWTFRYSCCLNISLQLLSEHFATAAVWIFRYSCCLNISLQLLSEHFATAAVWTFRYSCCLNISHSKKNWARYDRKCMSVFM